MAGMIRRDQNAFAIRQGLSEMLDPPYFDVNKSLRFPLNAFSDRPPQPQPEAVQFGRPPSGRTFKNLWIHDFIPYSADHSGVLINYDSHIPVNIFATTVPGSLIKA
jgi:hypothetical protein